MGFQEYDGAEILDAFSPVEQMAIGNCGRASMYYLGAHGPGILIAKRDKHGIIKDASYITREMSREHFEKGFPRSQNDWYHEMQTYDPLSARLIALSSTESPYSQIIMMPLSFQERPTASIMSRTFEVANQTMSLPKTDIVFSEKAQERYTPENFKRRQNPSFETGSRPVQMPPQLSKKVTQAMRYPPAYQNMQPLIAAAYMPHISATLSEWIQEEYNRLGRGATFVILEEGGFMPLFVDNMYYLPGAVLRRYLAAHPSPPENEVDDQMILEKIETYDPATQQLLVVIKPDADPSRLISIIDEPDKTFTPDEAYDVADRMMKDILSQPRQVRTPRGKKRYDGQE